MSAISLYIHIPFCTSLCPYCDFYSREYDSDRADRLIDGLAQEWNLVSRVYSLQDAPIATLYIGGGTPSRLSCAQWERLHAGLIGTLPLSQDVEWSVECNPESYSQDTTRLWLDMGVSRVTLGVQSLVDTELRALGRPHTAEQSLRVLDDAVLERFSSVGADLMYGIPGQSPDSLRQSLELLLSRRVVAHLSAYELTLYEGTEFGEHRDSLDLPTETALVDMAQLLLDTCRAHGLERYEISNFSRPGHHSRHNNVYWNHAPYVGLGPAAHSYLHPRRWSNVADTDAYVAAISRGERPLGSQEIIDAATLGREMIFLGLRTSEGIDERRFEEATNEVLRSKERAEVLDELVNGGLMVNEDSRWRLTDAGMLVADEVARRLM